jgi:hypothetical protein
MAQRTFQESVQRIFRRIYGNRFFFLVFLLGLFFQGKSYPSVEGGFGSQRCQGLFLDTMLLLTPDSAHTDADSLAYLSPEQVQLLTRSLLKDKAHSYEAWSQRAFVNIIRGRIFSEVQKSCTLSIACTESMIAQIVEREISQSFETLHDFQHEIRRFKGLAILVGISVGVAVTSQYTKGHLPPDVQWISEFVTIASTIALYKLGGPLWDYFGGLAYQGAFRLSEGKSFMKPHDDMSYLTEQYQILQEKMTPFQQQESLRIMNFLNSLEVGLSSALDLIHHPDAHKNGFDRGAARIAALLIKIRRLYPELSPYQDIDVMRTVNLLLANHLDLNIVDRSLLAEAILAKTIEYDPTVNQDPSLYTLYRESAYHWVGLKDSRE